MARLRNIFTALFAVSALMTCSMVNAIKGGTDTGVHASLDLRTLSLAKDAIFDKIIGFIDDVKIPDV